jgi:hypothetical protein
MAILDNDSLSKLQKSLDENHSKIKDRDWRLQAISIISEDWKSPTGVIHKAGTPIMTVTFFEYPERASFFTIPLPNPSAIYLSLALNAKKAGEALMIELEKILVNEDIAILPKEKETEFFNSIGLLISCIIFSYTGIEAFANASIPDEFQFQKNRQDKRCTEIFSKEQIEKNINLDTKLDEVLPIIYKLKSPKGTRIWNNYKWLESMRDRFIHLKSSDWTTPLDKTNIRNVIWTKILSKEVLLAPNYAYDIIKYFYIGNEPRWLRQAPIEDKSDI